MDMPGVTPDMACSADYSVDDIYAEVREDDNSEMRHIDIEVVVGLKVKVRQKTEYPVVVDLYAPSKRIEPESLDVAMDSYFGRNTSQVVIKENIPLPDDYPEMEKIYDAICKPVVTDCKLEEEKVVVEGLLSFNIIYLAKDEKKLVHSLSDELPFKSQIPVPGCRMDMTPEVNVDIENMDINLVKKNEVEVKVTLGCLAEVYEKIKKSFITKVEEVEGENPIHKASITIYMVQPKDTLWKIAKRYFTTIDNIIKNNEIQDADNLQPGTKLIIPKKL
jgi:LysM repeat protein